MFLKAFFYLCNQHKLNAALSPLERGQGCVTGSNLQRKIIPYNPSLKILARKLRNNSTKSEIILWHYLKSRQMLGYDFHRQKPIDNYIIDFFCYELMLAIELDGYSHQLDEVYEKDKKKEQKMNEPGISILRFSDDEVYFDINNVLEELRFLL